MDLRGRRVPWWWGSEDEEDLREKGLRDLDFGFGLEVSGAGISEGTQRTPGRRPRSLAFISVV